MRAIGAATAYMIWSLLQRRWNPQTTEEELWIIAATFLLSIPLLVFAAILVALTDPWDLTPNDKLSDRKDVQGTGEKAKPGSL